MKLVLFDIDGTLISTGGAGLRAMSRVFAQLYGDSHAVQGIAFAGRTDRVIVRDVMARLAPEVVVDDHWLARFCDAYYALLEEEMRHGGGTGQRVLPGIRPLVEVLAGRDDVALALLTGNFERAAQIKLGHFDLWKYFAWGAFGDAHVDRNELMALALQTARIRFSAPVAADQVFVIGDTPHDVACARSGAARAIAVATGFSSAEELRTAGADVVFEDLSDSAAVLRELAL